MIIVNQTLTKEQLFSLCKTHCDNFLNANKIPIVPVYNQYTQYRGFYMPGKRPYIVVNVNNTLTPRYNPTPRNQSFPNHKTDSTPIGVLAHEVGHSVDWYLRTKGIQLAKDFRKLMRIEPQVTSYDTIAIERVAEAMRLFILNPELLRLGRPRAYDILIAHLKPTVTNNWYDAYAPIGGNNESKYLHWASQWIKRGNNKSKELELF
jgi:hypothetical protein